MLKIILGLLSFLSQFGNSAAAIAASPENICLDNTKFEITDESSDSSVLGHSEGSFSASPANQNNTCKIKRVSTETITIGSQDNGPAE